MNTIDINNTKLTPHNAEQMLRSINKIIINSVEARDELIKLKDKFISYGMRHDLLTNEIGEYSKFIEVLRKDLKICKTIIKEKRNESA